jgi:ABC-2 type transport system permease protein
VLGVAVLLGFRPATGPLGWLGVLGLITLVAFALTWIAVGMGLTSRNPEAASNAVLPLQFLPFLATAFVPTDSMPTVLRWFATYQPFTPVIETLRHLLSGAAAGSAAPVAVAWCLALAAAGYAWSRWAFRRAALR